MNEYIVTRKSDGAEVARYTADLPSPEDLANPDYSVAGVSNIARRIKGGIHA